MFGGRRGLGWYHRWTEIQKTWPYIDWDASNNVIIIIIGIRQSKKELDNFDNFPLIKPTTKILFGSFMCIFGAIQMLPLLKYLNI